MPKEIHYKKRQYSFTFSHRCDLGPKLIENAWNGPGKKKLYQETYSVKIVKIVGTGPKSCSTSLRRVNCYKCGQVRVYNVDHIFAQL